MTDMRVLHVVTLVSESGAFGGPTSVAISQLRELQRRGYQVELFSLHDGRRACTNIEGVPVTLLKARQLLPGMSFVGQANWHLIPVLLRLVRNADVVHVHAGRDLVSLCALTLCRLTRTPYVTQTHGMIMPRAGVAAMVFDAVLRPLLRAARARLVLTPTEAVALEEVTRGATTFHLHNGVDVSDEYARLPGSPPCVLFLARLQERKRPLVFIDMAEELARRGCTAEFTIIGPDEGQLPLVLQRLSEPLAATVRYAGALDHENAMRRLAEADVYVLPSVDEPFPMTVIEAIASGTPVVCTHSCGLAPILHNMEGARVTDGSARELATAVMDLIEAVSWPARSRSVQRLARASFGIDTVVDELEHAYRSVLELDRGVVQRRRKESADTAERR